MLWEREGSSYCRRRRVIHAVVEGGFSVLWEREGSPCCGRESVLHAVGECSSCCGRVFFMLWEREGSPCSLRHSMENPPSGLFVLSSIPWID